MDIRPSVYSAAGGMPVRQGVAFGPPRWPQRRALHRCQFHIRIAIVPRSRNPDKSQDLPDHTSYIVIVNSYNEKIMLFFKSTTPSTALSGLPDRFGSGGFSCPVGPSCAPCHRRRSGNA
ncbi:hypothetical protein [Gluconacetobacter diazotrophicus]|uniref:hypothetical protein n=1 Tax=Gluconacetobacter diazotrophicus TaxID=33996 RepID=UPI001389EC0A|nr:hypothetical protein [Gluconacetobacter diazotrophicus]